MSALGGDDFGEFVGRGWAFEFGFEFHDDLPEKFAADFVVHDFWELAWDEKELGWFHFFNSNCLVLFRRER